MDFKGKHKNSTVMLGFAICLFVILSQTSSFVLDRITAEAGGTAYYLAAIALQIISALLPYIVITAVYGTGPGFGIPEREETAVIIPLFFALFFAYYSSSLICSTIFGYSGAYMPAVPIPSEDPWSMVLLIVQYVIVPAVLEELLFRRAMINAIMPYGKWFAVTMSSLLFAMSHWERTRVIPVFVFSFFLSVVYMETKNLLIPSVIHLLNNALAFAGLYISTGIDQDTSSSVMMTAAVIGFVCFIILAATLPLGSIFAPEEHTAKAKRNFWSFPVAAAFLAYTLLLALS